MHMQYSQHWFCHVLPRQPECESPTFAVLWRTSVYLHLFCIGNQISLLMQFGTNKHLQIFCSL